MTIRIEDREDMAENLVFKVTDAASQELTAGAQLKTGDSVYIYVSRERSDNEVKVPDITNMTLEDAKKLLSSTGSAPWPADRSVFGCRAGHGGESEPEGGGGAGDWRAGFRGSFKGPGTYAGARFPHPPQRRRPPQAQHPAQAPVRRPCPLRQRSQQKGLTVAIECAGMCIS